MARFRHRGASLAEIEAVYRRRLDEFRSVAAAILCDREAAADVVQDAFALAVRRRSASPRRRASRCVVVASGRSHCAVGAAAERTAASRLAGRGVERSRGAGIGRP